MIPGVQLEGQLLTVVVRDMSVDAWPVLFLLAKGRLENVPASLDKDGLVSHRWAWYGHGAQ